MLKIGSISSFLAKLKPVDKEKLRQQKLNEIFQVDNEVRCLRTGRVYTVFDVTLGSALMIDKKDNVMKASWLSSAGRIRTEVADQWDLVSTESRIRKANLAKWAEVSSYCP